MAYVPNRGDAVWLNFNPQSGHEQSGRRPAVVISPLAYNKRVSLGIFCPITTKVKGYPFEVLIPGGLKVTGAILSDQVKNLDWKARDVELICQIPEATMQEVLKKLLVLIKPN
jgi:mRNA interferase MazF